MNKNKYNPQGKHWLIDIHDFPNISSKRTLDILVESAKVMGASVCGSFETEIQSERVTYVILGESHLIVHDFKNKIAILDMLTCGNINIELGFSYIQQQINFNSYNFALKTKWPRESYSSSS
jgi:S-adenosylmethionine/arginine decarboxylase-like enzyme